MWNWICPTLISDVSFNHRATCRERDVGVDLPGMLSARWGWWWRRRDGGIVTTPSCWRLVNLPSGYNWIRFIFLPFFSTQTFFFSAGCRRRDQVREMTSWKIYLEWHARTSDSYFPPQPISPPAIELRYCCCAPLTELDYDVDQLAHSVLYLVSFTVV